MVTRHTMVHTKATPRKVFKSTSQSGEFRALGRGGGGSLIHVNFLNDSSHGRYNWRRITMAIADHARAFFVISVDLFSLDKYTIVPAPFIHRSFTHYFLHRASLCRRLMRSRLSNSPCTLREVRRAHRDQLQQNQLTVTHSVTTLRRLCHIATNRPPE